MLRSALVCRLGTSSSRDCDVRRSELIAIGSRERGEPPLLCADDDAADEYGEGGRSCECAGDARARARGAGERDERRRLRDCGLEGA